MTARTLEEIEALASEATPGPYSLHECSHGAELMMLGGPSRKYVATVRIHQVPRHMGEWEEAKRTKTAALIATLPDLLAIAQEQRAELLRRPRVGSCIWVSLDSDMDTRIWSTSCKQEWVFHAGSPQENGVKFCPHCGAEAEIEMPQDGD